MMQVSNQDLTSYQKLYITWLKSNHPLIYKKALSEMGNKTLSGCDSCLGGFFEEFTKTLKEIVPLVIQAKREKIIIKIQTERAKQGLPPLDMDTMTPVLKIQTELSPEMIRQGKSAGIKIGIPLIFGLGVLTFFFLRKNRRK